MIYLTVAFIACSAVYFMAKNADSDSTVRVIRAGAYETNPHYVSKNGTFSRTKFWAWAWLIWGVCAGMFVSSIVNGYPWYLHAPIWFAVLGVTSAEAFSKASKNHELAQRLGG